MPRKAKAAPRPETAKERWDRMKVENHEAQAKRAAANARTRELLKIGASAPIPKGYNNGEQPVHNRRSRRAIYHKNTQHGRRRRAATRMVMPGFEPPWRVGPVGGEPNN